MFCFSEIVLFQFRFSVFTCETKCYVVTTWRTKMLFNIKVVENSVYILVSIFSWLLIRANAAFHESALL